MQVRKGKRKIGKKFFCVSVLLLMFMLVVGTIAFAEVGGGTGSYTLIIRKKFAEGSPDWAKDATYHFKVKGVLEYRGGRSADGRTAINTEPVERDVEIKGDGEAVLKFDAVARLSVIELSEVTGAPETEQVRTDYTCESVMPVTGTKSEVSIKKDGGKITIEKENYDGSDSRIYTYRITGKKRNFSKLLKVQAGKSNTLEDVPAGDYEVEEIEAEGYRMLLKNESVVPAGTEKEISIPWESMPKKSKVKVTAPNDGREHYYELSRKGWQEIKKAGPGETCEWEDLPDGDYTVKESIYQGMQGYVVEYPEANETKTYTYSNVGKFMIYTPAWKSPSEGDYIWLKISQINLNSGASSFNGQFKGVWLDGFSPNEVRWLKNCKQGYVSTMPYPLAVEPFKFAAAGSSQLQSCRVNAYLCTPKTVPVQDKKNITISDIPVLTITKPKDTSNRPGADQLKFTYTLTKIGGGTSTPPKTVTIPASLSEDSSVKVTGLSSNAAYLVEEAVEGQLAPADFSVTVEEETESGLAGNWWKSVKKGYSMEIHMLGDMDDEEPYHFDIEIQPSGGSRAESKAEDVQLNVGQIWRLEPDYNTDRTVIVEGTTKLKTGYQLSYSDSNMVVVNISGSSEISVTVTNTFNKREEGSYRYVHEYYLKDKDGSLKREDMKLEDWSEPQKVDAPLDGRHYTADDVGQKPYGPNTGWRYTHFEDAYGIYSGPNDTAKTTVELTDVPIATPSNAIWAEEEYELESEEEEPGKTEADEGNLDESENPGGTGNADGVKNPGGTGNADGVKNPGGTGNTDGVKNPGGTGNADGVKNPSGTDNPDGAGNADESENPGGTDNPDETENPGAESNRTDETIKDEPDIPDTGEMLPGDRGLPEAAGSEDKDGGDESRGSEGGEDIKADGQNGAKIRKASQFLPAIASSKDSGSVTVRRDTEQVFRWNALPYNRAMYQYMGQAYVPLAAAGVTTDAADTDKADNGSTDRDPGGEDTGAGGSGSTDPGNEGTDSGGSGSTDPGSGGSGNTDPGNEGTGSGGSTDPGNEGTGSGGSGNTDPGDEGTGSGGSGSTDPGDEGTDSGGSGSTDPGNEGTDSGGSGSTDPGNEGMDSGGSGSTDPGNEGTDSDGSGSTDPGNEGTDSDGSGSTDPGDGGTDNGDTGSTVPSEEETKPEETEEEKPGSGSLTPKETKEEEETKETEEEELEEASRLRAMGLQNYEPQEGMEYVVAKENGEQIIILRYYREVDDNETEPETTPSGGGGGGGGGGGDDPDPTKPSTPPTDPSPEPSTEPSVEEPTSPEELPDPNDPDSPERVTIWEDGVPKTYLKVWDPETEQWIYILEEEVPLAWQSLPKTGDKIVRVLWMAMFMGSSAGMILLTAARRRKGRNR